MNRRLKIEACLALAERSPFEAERETARRLAKALSAKSPPEPPRPIDPKRKYRSGISGGIRARVLQAFVLHFAERGASPTLIEIGEATGLNKNLVCKAVDHLVHDGLLEREPRKRRGVRLPAAASEAIPILLPAPAR